MTTFRDYTFLGTTQSLCPDCLGLVPAKIISRGKRVYFRKRCPQHGIREDFVCSDVNWFDRNESTLPGKVPLRFGLEPDRGCPFDCGLCTEHEQHTCIGLLEITSDCNLKCPVCFAGSGPGGTNLTLAECTAAIDRLVEVEGEPEVLQLSGGEPTIHPEFFEILTYACAQPIDIVMVNTNGLRIADDLEFVDRLAEFKHRCEVYLQFDSFEDPGYKAIRGRSFVEAKLAAVEALGERGIRTTLVCTVQAGVNDTEVARIADFAMQRRWITGLSFQPTTYTGRTVLPDTLESRVTFPDIIRRLARDAGSVWRATDFSPLPCAHPNAHTIAYAYRETVANSPTGTEVLPLARIIDFDQHLELLAGRITYNRDRARELVQQFLRGMRCGPTGCEPDDLGAMFVPLGPKFDPENPVESANPLAAAFFTKALARTLEPEDLMRITTTSFMDAYNFDVRQLMKSCVHHMLPSGHLIPFSAYNVLYRNGHVPLPEIGSVGVRA